MRMTLQRPQAMPRTGSQAHLPIPGGWYPRQRAGFAAGPEVGFQVLCRRRLGWQLQ